MTKVEILGGVVGIPPAPGGKRIFNLVDHDFQQRKLKYGYRLPFMTEEEVARNKHPYHVLLLHDLMAAGMHEVVQEVNNILRKEEREKKSGRYRHLMRRSLVSDKAKYTSILENLQVCKHLVDEGNYEAATVLRKGLGEKLMKEGDIWLAKHFLFSALQTCDSMVQESRLRLGAEIHCLLAFLVRDNTEDLEQALEFAVDHLTMCRELSKDQPWQFRPKVLTIKLKKPITLHGLREEYEIVDGSSMTIYMIATLLEHEMLIGLANQILHTHRYPTEADILTAHEFADNALKLAFEVRQPIALSSALMRFGVVLRHTGAFDDALYYFTQLSHHSEITGDHDGYAIAYHNIALCQVGKYEIMQALESLTMQKELAESNNLEDLEADALQEIGHILLQEGQLWEAEEAYTWAYDEFARLEEINQPPHSHCDNSLAMLAITAGQKVWSRFAGLARNETTEHFGVLVEWKNRRQALVPVPRPNYKTIDIDQQLELEEASNLNTSRAGSSDQDLHHVHLPVQPETTKKGVIFQSEKGVLIEGRPERRVTVNADSIDTMVFESDKRPVPIGRPSGRPSGSRSMAATMTLNRYIDNAKAARKSFHSYKLSY